MESVIVTGGAGFIGCNFVRLALAQTAMRVVVVDKLTYAGNLKNLDAVAPDPRFSFVHADIADRGAIERVYQEHRPTWVVNFAAESHVDRSIDRPQSFVHTNVVGTFELLEVTRAYVATCDAPARARFRFLHVSTDEVYGSLGASGRFSETTPYAPNSPYAASKAAADHFVRAYYETFGVPVLLTNCSNNYGPFQFPEKLIPLTLLNAVEGKPLPIYGDGRNVRDWIFVEDHCAGVLRVLQAGRVGEKYNLGADTELPNVAVVDEVCRALEACLPARRNAALVTRQIGSYVALKTFVQDRPGHDRRYAIDAGKARRELGWQPARDFASGIMATVRWYLDHLDWCEAVQAGGYHRERLGVLTGRAGEVSGRTGGEGKP